MHSTLNVSLGRAWRRSTISIGAPKHALEEKAFGVYRHRNLASLASVYLNGFSDDFEVPVSRWTEVRRRGCPGGNAGAGHSCLIPTRRVLCLVREQAGNRLYMFNHVEYDLPPRWRTNISATCIGRRADLAAA